MAAFTGIEATKADEILDQSVVSGEINEFGHLILTRHDGSEIDAGDFTGIVTGILNAEVSAAVATAVPNAIAGTVVNKGNVSGSITFAEFNSTNILNAMIRLVATGNITINAANLPAAPRPNTQFAVKVKQDATGGRTVTFTGFKKSQGVLVPTTTPNAEDIFMFLYDGTGWYAGAMGVDFQ
jgi:hypothetical protein